MKPSPRIRKNLACPNCLGSLQLSNESVLCNDCGERYRYTKNDNLDLRLNNPKKYSYEFSVGVHPILAADVGASPLEANPNPQVSYSDFTPPKHLTRTLLSYFPKALSDDALMLDLGCGTALHRAVAEHAGFEYLGIDYNNAEAPVLGDAHAIPLQDSSVEFVLSIAVLEHIRFPLIMMKEVNRVLKPNGTFIGTVAFLEPFHEESYYHHTHLGVYNALKEGGFIIEKIASSDEWNSMTAQLHMGLFPKLPIWVARVLTYPVKVLHKIWWKLGSLLFEDATEDTRIAKNTGAFTFIARKP